MGACSRLRAKGVASCGECPAFPCDILKGFDADEHPHHSVVLKNLEAVRAGVFDGKPGNWGQKRLPVRLAGVT